LERQKHRPMCLALVANGRMILALSRPFNAGCGAVKLSRSSGSLRLFPNLLARRISWIILKVSLVSLRTLAKKLTIYKAQASENQTNRGLENK